MRVFKGTLLLESMVAVFLMGVLLLMASTGSPRKYGGSAEETPVIILGLLNEEMKGAAEKMSFNQITVIEQTLVHSNHRLKMTKRSTIDGEVRLLYDSMYDPKFKASTSYNYEINGTSPKGSIYFYRTGKLEALLTIMVGTMAMDVRKQKN